MRRTNVLFIVVLASLGVLATACSTRKPVATAAPAVAPAPQPTPTPMAEEQVAAPSNEPVPSVEVHEELPQDLQELNRRGYLKDVFFATDEYDLTAEARETLAADADWLRKHPTVRILIEGHADERNTREYNLALGERRAAAAQHYLVSLGIDASRIRTISYGEERPFAVGHDEAAWQLNRRSHFVIVAR